MNALPIDLKWTAVSDSDSARLYRDNPQLHQSHESYCPTCLKKGEYQWQGKTVKCDCQEQLQLHKHYLAAGIGDTYQRLSWDDYVGDPKASAMVQDYLKNHELFVARGIGIMFSGIFGTGKTMALSLLLKDLLKIGYSVYSTTFASMVDSYTAGWNSMEDKEHFNRKMRSSQILLLDDIGKEFKTKNQLSETTFDSVLRFRIQNSKPTFITTNMNNAEMRSGYGSAIFSLLDESALKYDFVTEFDSRKQIKGRTIQEIRNGQTRPIN